MYVGSKWHTCMYNVKVSRHTNGTMKDVFWNMISQKLRPILVLIFFFKNCSIHWLKHVCFAKPQHKYAKSFVIATKLNHSKFRFVSVRIEACNNKYLKSSSCYYRFNYLFEFKFMIECLVILNQCLEFRYSDHNWRIYY